MVTCSFTEFWYSEDSVAPPQWWRRQSTIKCHRCGDQQLEAILSSRRCSNEQGLLDSTSVHVGIVHTQGSTQARGSTLELDVKIEGVKVEAMVDTGAQSSIISRPVLHKVGIYI